MFGLLNVDKPAGVTSRDIVNRVQRLVRPLKVGHAGTLDPLATGVLVVGIGQATRLVEYVQRMPKTYLATFLLGQSSDTEDVKGNVVLLAVPHVPSELEILAALPQFVGTIEQRPPAYSALKVAGQRSYDLARRGQSPELSARPVEIYALDLVGYAYPRLVLRIRCGSGTYVRSLGRDLARSLRSDAILAALRREAIGAFRAEEAIGMADLTLDAITKALLSPRLALGDMPQIVLEPDEIHRLSQGQTIVRTTPTTASGELATVDQAGKLVAIVTADDGGTLKATKYFPAI